MDMDRRNLIAQWVFDTRAVLGRFHLWLEDVDETWVRGSPVHELSFAGPSLEKAFMMSVAVTALGTQLYGRYGEGKGLDKAGINRVKKDADAVSAYAMSEGLWYLTRNLPESHAVMVSLGEGLMPKVGETPEMGSNPQLGFGRVYARPRVAQWLDHRVHRLINHREYRWDEFWSDVRSSGITIWGAAVDTLENTSRFANGAPTGSMAVLHMFDQPLNIALPYEGYMGTLTLPREVVRTAAEDSILADYLAPRALILDAIRKTFPGIQPANVHVWSLGGRSREGRIGKIWSAWRSLGVHVIEDGWRLPGGSEAFTESGTYAPTFRVGVYRDDRDNQHLLICDGYAASAEAIQAASLDPMLGLHTSLSLFSSKFKVSFEREARIMQLDPDGGAFAEGLRSIVGEDVKDAEVSEYQGIVKHAREANLPLGARSLTVGDFFPNKKWRALAVSAGMLPDPYTNMPGVEKIDDGCYRVTSRAVTRKGILQVTFTLRLMDPPEIARRVFSPLLDRFYAGEDYRTRPVKISDSGRIRNELQTLCSEALEYFAEDGVRVFFDRIEDAVLPPEKRKLVREVLEWYKRNHPIWFRWLEIA